MKKLLLSLLLVPALAFTVNYSDPLEIGSVLPKADRKMKDITGKEVSFNDIKTNNGLLVMFSCNTCPWIVVNCAMVSEFAAFIE